MQQTIDWAIYLNDKYSLDGRGMCFSLRVSCSGAISLVSCIGRDVCVVFVGLCVFVFMFSVPFPIECLAWLLSWVGLDGLDWLSVSILNRDQTPTALSVSCGASAESMIWDGQNDPSLARSAS